MIRKILIANRGEIACRIIKTCHKMGIFTVAVFSAADQDSLHVRMADEAICLGAPPQVYLNIETTIEAAKRSGADAIHPGFGFLAENPDFALACKQKNIVFIGPDSEVILQMGNKAYVRELALEVDVPIIPGYAEKGAVDTQTDKKLVEEAEKIGFPIMVKPAAGGGGKGMRLVAKSEDLASAIHSARREAQNAFANTQLIVETAFINPRHIEVQILGDNHGNIVHLGERECSIQRRHQKIIEETPAPSLAKELREKMFTAALRLAKKLEYTNAGTVEFILMDDQFYLLEVNTRLQVEHPVTEMVTGLDLVEWQICIAEGQELPLKQQQIERMGHSIESRVYAEDPDMDFLPASGDILLCQFAQGSGVRIDTGITSGDTISSFYDPLVAKIVVYGQNRQVALRKMSYALSKTSLLGIKNNIKLLAKIINHPSFIKGNLETSFIDKHQINTKRAPENFSIALSIVSVLCYLSKRSPNTSGYWRNNPNLPIQYNFTNVFYKQIETSILPESKDLYQITCHQKSSHLQVISHTEDQLECVIDGHRQKISMACSENCFWLKVGHDVWDFNLVTTTTGVGNSKNEKIIIAPMTGKIIEIAIAKEQYVEKGQLLMIMEAMKMEYQILAPDCGKVVAISCLENSVVDKGVQLVELNYDI